MNSPVLTLGRKPGRFVLTHDYDWRGITVGAGFVTDFDSVPRIPIFHAWLKGRAVASALVHDYLYRIGYDRKKADKLFLEAMREEGVRRRYRYPIYWAVRVFGGRAYRR